VQRSTQTEAVKVIEAALAVGPRRGLKPDADQEVAKHSGIYPHRAHSRRMQPARPLVPLRAF